jgi:hypothetical protein
MVSIRKLPLSLWERVGVRGTKIKYIYIPNHYHPHPAPPPSRGRKFIINFKGFTLSPAGRG